MPRPKNWIGKIPHILQYLEADDRPDYTRRQAEQLFGIGHSQAAELMEIAGLSRPARDGVDSLVSRRNLLSYVKHSPEAQEALREIERRKRLAAKLRQGEEELRLRQIQLRVTKDDEWTRFAELPNVAVQPGLMQVAFTPGDPIDLMDTLHRFLKAAGNDWDEFRKMCEPQAPAASPELPSAQQQQMEMEAVG